jgi:hypothetical protein
VSATRPFFLGVALALAAQLPVSHAGPAPDAGALAHCAAISTADERLACYDSLARPTPKPSPPPAATAASPSAKASPKAPAAGAAAPATGGAATGAQAAAATAAPAGAAAGAAATTAGTAAGGTADPKSFGLTKHTAPSDAGPDHIQARVIQVDTNRLNHVRVSLDNGQAWTFTATDAVVRVGDPITIKRGVLGSYLLTTAHHTYKAERLQ